MNAVIRFHKFHGYTTGIEYYIDGGRADVIFVSQAGYVHEVEIKISLADWNNDRKKYKFSKEHEEFNKKYNRSKHVAYFWYLISPSLRNQIPKWIPEDVGIMTIKHHRDYRFLSDYHEQGDRIEVLRTAKRRKHAKKFTEGQMKSLLNSMYFRFWAYHYQHLGSELKKHKQKFKMQKP